VFSADAANFIFCPAQQVAPLVFVHKSIMARIASRGFLAVSR
jgi:hypothetical protein